MRQISVIFRLYRTANSSDVCKSRSKGIGVDVNEQTCTIINNGGIHIEEPYLGDIVESRYLRE